MRKAGVVCAVAAAAGDVAKSCCESLVARKEEREGSSCETAAARPAQKNSCKATSPALTFSTWMPNVATR